MTRHHIPTRPAAWLTALGAALILGALPQAAAAQSATSPVVQVTANGSVDQVVEQLRKMVASNGMMVMGELHQGKVIGMTGLKIESETIFVGNPEVGKQLFGADPGVGVAVPVRINVFRNTQGATVVSYLPPSELLKGFHNQQIDQVAQMLDGKLHDMLGMLGGSFFPVSQAGGLLGYLASFARPKAIMLPLNLVSQVTRTFSLMVRLFGNVMSGEFVIALVVALAGLLVPIPLMALEILVGLVQAYIFTVLATVFIGAAVGGGEAG